MKTCSHANFDTQQIHRSLPKWLLKCVSRSTTMLLGMPCCITTQCKKKSAVSYAVSCLLVGTRCTIFVALSVMVKSALKVPRLLVISGRPDIQSKCTDCHLRDGICKGCRATREAFLSVLNFWRMWHEETWVFTFSLMFWKEYFLWMM